MMGDDEIEDWDEIEEVDLSKKRYFSDSWYEKYTFTQEEVIKSFKDVHGDRYDYSKVDYQGSRTKVIIICKEHGEFLQTPMDHKKGNNCSTCSHRETGQNRRTTPEEIIQLFRKAHGDRYDYSKVDYQLSRTKVIIICKEHGEFLQRSRPHKEGAGCPKCVGKDLTTQDVVKGFKDVHGDRYDYSKVNYVKPLNKVIIICKEHGEFLQSVRAHKSLGRGCPKCKGIGLTTQDIIKEFKTVHGDRYDYSKVDYQGSRTKVIIICKEHGEFLQNHNGHRKGRGCPKCGRISQSQLTPLSKWVINAVFKNVGK